VSLPGGVPWSELQDVYRGHDVFVRASAPTRFWREQVGFALVEAMGCGLPVLLGDSDSLMEVAGSPQRLVRPHDPPALADELEALIGDPELRRREGEASRARALEHYDQRVIRERLGELYSRVLAG
jgi:glycosyltransferase involved in cell wall biosynthesis